MLSEAGSISLNNASLIRRMKGVTRAISFFACGVRKMQTLRLSAELGFLIR
jgi:hypothetical protein